MATMLDSHWPLIRERIMARVAANSSAGLMSVISSMIQDKTIEWNNYSQVSDEEKQTIMAPLLEIGQFVSVTVGDEIYITKNPNYDLNESIKRTNISVQDLNERLKTTNFWSVFFTGLTTVFIILTFFKDCSKGRRPTQPQLQKQSQILDSIEPYKKATNPLYHGSDTLKRP